MRLSLRKVVKYAVFLFIFFVLNVSISYNVNFWSFNNFEDRGKVEKTLTRRGLGDGGAWPSPPRDGNGGQKLSDGLDDNEYLHKQRSAKSVNGESNNDISLLNSLNGFDRVNGSEKDVPLVASVNKGEQPVIKDAENTNGVQKLKSFLPTKSPLTDLTDIFISVKTTEKYHQSRIQLLLKTWYLLGREQVYFFTDGEDENLRQTLGDHLVNTNCSTDHSRRALSCKMAVEIDYYMASRKRWFCHMDDDVYLNIPRLVEVLREYNHKEDWYLGKPSLKHPLEVNDRENPGMRLAFWFATGGAGFCISRSLALKMAPYASGGRFMTTAERIRLPDDCTIGYIIEHILRKQLTVLDEFHSHLEPLWAIQLHQLKSQITLSFSEAWGKQNMLNIEGFSVEEDPTRFRSLHCFLFPNFRDCRELTLPPT